MVIAPELLAKITHALKKRGIPYRVIGGQAVSVYTESRAAEDIDITLGVTLQRLCAVRNLAVAVGLEPLLVPAAFTQESLVFPCRDRATGIRVDFLFAASDYDYRALRCSMVKLGETEVCFAAAEDVVVQKIVAGRPQDLADARAVLRKRPDLDLSYIRRCLRELEAAFESPLLERFEQVRQGSEAVT